MVVRSIKKSVFPSPQSVRDWSDILCELEWGFGNGEWDFGTRIGERDGNEASKDIAESPTRSGTPKKKGVRVIRELGIGNWELGIGELVF